MWAAVVPSSQLLPGAAGPGGALRWVSLGQLGRHSNTPPLRLAPRSPRGLGALVVFRAPVLWASLALFPRCRALAEAALPVPSAFLTEQLQHSPPGRSSTRRGRASAACDGREKTGRACSGGEARGRSRQPGEQPAEVVLSAPLMPGGTGSERRR